MKQVLLLQVLFLIFHQLRTNVLIVCYLIAKVYINLIDQKEPTLDFVNQDEKKEIIEKGKIYYFKKVVKISDEEKKSHKEYLKKTLKKNYFN